MDTSARPRRWELTTDLLQISGGQAAAVVPASPGGEPAPSSASRPAATRRSSSSPFLAATSHPPPTSTTRASFACSPSRDDLSHCGCLITALPAFLHRLPSQRAPRSTWFSSVRALAPFRKPLSRATLLRAIFLRHPARFFFARVRPPFRCPPPNRRISHPVSACFLPHAKEAALSSPRLTSLPRPRTRRDGRSVSAASRPLRLRPLSFFFLCAWPLAAPVDTASLPCRGPPLRLALPCRIPTTEFRSARPSAHVPSSFSFSLFLRNFPFGTSRSPFQPCHRDSRAAPRPSPRRPRTPRLVFPLSLLVTSRRCPTFPIAKPAADVLSRRRRSRSSTPRLVFRHFAVAALVSRHRATIRRETLRQGTFRRESRFRPLPPPPRPYAAKRHGFLAHSFFSPFPFSLRFRSFEIHRAPRSPRFFPRISSCRLPWLPTPPPSAPLEIAPRSLFRSHVVFRSVSATPRPLRFGAQRNGILSGSRDVGER